MAVGGKRWIDESISDLFRVISSFLIFVLIFSGLYIVFMDHIAFLNSLTASILGFILSVSGLDVTTNGSIVRLDGFEMEIVDECTGIYEMLVYAAAVLAFPTTTSKKVAGIVLGIPLLAVLNMARLISLAYVGIWNPEIFDFVHLYLWQVTLVFLIVIVLSVWIYGVVKIER